MISIILTIIAFILIVSLYFDQPLTLNLLSFISTVIFRFHHRDVSFNHFNTAL